MDFDQRGIIKSKKIIAAFNFGTSLQLNGGEILEQENLSGTSEITPQKTLTFYTCNWTFFSGTLSFFLEVINLRQ